MLDLLNYFTMADQSAKLPFSRETHHMEGNANPLYTAVWTNPTSVHPNAPVKIWWMKDPAGHPWDISLVDENFIYWWITEWNDAAPNNFWAIPSNYKRFDGNGYALPGIPLIPRFLPKGMSIGSSIQLFTPQSKATYMKNCTAFQPGGQGDILGVTWAPTPMNNGGNIPDETLTVVTEYRYGGANGVYKFRERYFGALNYGLVQWDYAGWDGNAFQQKQVTYYNKLVKGGAPTPIFPCQNP